MSYTGWGVFNIPVTITFSKELGIEPITLDHMLSFDGAGACNIIEVPIERKTALKLKLRLPDN